MSVIENNKLIAEFMGCELEETLDGLMVYAIKWGVFPHDDSGLTRTEFYEPEELRYNKSMVWLRNVRRKVVEMGGSVDGRHIGKGYRDIVKFIKEAEPTRTN